jgi:YbbR domain-containing protein
MRARLALSERSGLLLLSLLLSVTMWYYVVGVHNPALERSITASLLVRDVEVAFVGLRDGWSAVAEPRTVDVELRGPVAVLSARTRAVQAVADLSALEAGTHRVTLRVQVPDGVTAWQAIPPAVRVTLARR